MNEGDNILAVRWYFQIERGTFITENNIIQNRATYCELPRPCQTLLLTISNVLYQSASLPVALTFNP